VTFRNIGGLVMPILLQLEYADGSTEMRRLPVEIWALNNETASHLVMTEKELSRVTLDPRMQTADVDLSNNRFPPEVPKSRFQLFKDQQPPNAMQKAGLGAGK
jgi:hypothetical protein